MAEEPQKDNSSYKRQMTPLVLIAAFLSLTEVVAVYTLLNTQGNIQFILTVFIVSFPVLVAIAFFYLLAFRNHVLFAPQEYPANGGVTTFVQAMREASRPRQDHQTEYPAAHSLFGILDSIKQELPSILNSMTEPPIGSVSIECDVSPYDPNTGSKSLPPGPVKRITVGSLTRKEAAERYPFLANEYTRLQTWRAIQALSSDVANRIFRICPDGTLYTGLDLISFQRAVSKKIDPKEFDDCIVLQAISLVHGQLFIVYFQVDALARKSPELEQVVIGLTKLPIYVSENSLVVSDQGDIYGIVADLFERAQLEMKLEAHNNKP